jgi:hypothetical protein
MRQALFVAVLASTAIARGGDAPYFPPVRNFDSVYRPGELAIDALAASVQHNSLTRPWYLTPYRNYAYYRPWYTYGYYGPTRYRYHYSPSWGYSQPWYGPQYLNPDALAPPPSDQLYHW